MRKTKRAARQSKQNGSGTRKSTAKKLTPLTLSSFPQTRKRKRSAREGEAPLVCPPSLQDLKDPSQVRDFSLDYSTTASAVPKVRVLFRNQKQALIDALREQEDVLVYGCVAWLTDFDILNAMAKKSLGIVVQKEEFLRPDKVLASRRMWTETLRRKYKATVWCAMHPHSFPDFRFESRLWDITCHGQYQHDEIGPVRCIGYHRRTGDFGVPLMHHKFLVFAKYHNPDPDDPDARDMPGWLEPLRVWTGSFNMSTNASNSLENVVVLDDKRIAEAYSKEWANLYLNSEPLDWTHVYAVQDPTDDFRVDT